MEARGNFVRRCTMICTLRQILIVTGDLIKEDGMGWDDQLALNGDRKIHGGLWLENLENRHYICYRLYSVQLTSQTLFLK